MSQWNFPTNFFNAPNGSHQRATIAPVSAIPPSVAALFVQSPASPTSLDHPNRTPPTNPIPIGNQPTTPKSSRSAGERGFHCVASMPLLEDRPLVPFYATAPRLGPQFLLRRQHSSSSAAAMYMGGQAKSRYAGAVGKNGRYTTPPPMRYGCSVVHKGSDEDEVPTMHFAASKFSDSPSAKSLPAPPSAWMEEIEKRMADKKLLDDAEKRDGGGKLGKKVEMDGIEEEEATSDDTGVVFDLAEDVSPTGSFDNENNIASSAPNTASSGIRVDPMKLIAAASIA